MGWRGRRAMLHRGWILLSLTGGLLLFQNMSFEEHVANAHRLAEDQPEPEFAYLPPNPSGRSPQALGSEILKHNFGDELRDVEKRLQALTTWESHSDHGGGASPPLADRRDIAGAMPAQPAGYKFKAGVMGRDHLGFVYEQGFRLKCEYAPLDQNLKLSVNAELTPRTHVSVQHRSESGESSVGLTYQW